MADAHVDTLPIPRRREPLFVDHPLSPAALKSGRETTQPYHCYDADALILAGDVDGKIAAELLAPEELAPVTTASGHAVASLWLMRYADTSLGPYVEIVLTLVATKNPTAPRAMAHVADYAALLLDPDIVVFCHRLLLHRDNDLAIAYGRDLLHLDKEGIDLRVERTPQGTKARTTTVSARHGAVDVLSADVAVGAGVWTQLGGMMRVMRQAGLSRTLAALKVSSVVVRGPARMGGGTVRAFLRGRIILRPFTARDRLTVAPGVALTDDLVRLQFAPKLVQRMPHAQFVMYPAE